MHQASYTSIDGGRIHGEFPGKRPTSFVSESSYVWLPEPGGLFTLLVSDEREYAMGLATNETIATGFSVTHEYSYMGGRLWAGSALPVQDQEGIEYFVRGPDGTVQPEMFNIVGWEGENHCVRTFSYGTQLDLVLEWFGSFQVNEIEDGVVCQPIQSTLVSLYEGPEVRLTVPDLGRVLIYGERSLSPFPAARHQGTAVRGGQLFRMPLETEDHPQFVLQDSRSTTVVEPVSVGDSALAAWLAKARFSWTYPDAA